MDKYLPHNPVNNPVKSSAQESQPLFPTSTPSEIGPKIPPFSGKARADPRKAMKITMAFIVTSLT